MLAIATGVQIPKGNISFRDYGRYEVSFAVKKNVQRLIAKRAGS